MKRRALQLLEDGWEMNKIEDVLGMSSKSIDRWQDNYEMHGRVNPPSFLQGRRRILSAGVVDDLCDLMQESPELYLDKIGIWLALYREVQISTTALHDNLQELGLTCKLMRHAAAERDHELRASWIYNKVGGTRNRLPYVIMLYKRLQHNTSFIWTHVACQS